LNAASSNSPPFSVLKNESANLSWSLLVNTEETMAFIRNGRCLAAVLPEKLTKQRTLAKVGRLLPTSGNAVATS